MDALAPEQQLRRQKLDEWKKKKSSLEMQKLSLKGANQGKSALKSSQESLNSTKNSGTLILNVGSSKSSLIDKSSLKNNVSSLNRSKPTVSSQSKKVSLASKSATAPLKANTSLNTSKLYKAPLKSALKPLKAVESANDFLVSNIDNSDSFKYAASENRTEGNSNETLVSEMNASGCLGSAVSRFESLMAESNPEKVLQSAKETSNYANSTNANETIAYAIQSNKTPKNNAPLKTILKSALRKTPDIFSLAPNTPTRPSTPQISFGRRSISTSSIKPAEVISEAMIPNLALPISKPCTPKSPHIKVAFGKSSVSSPSIKKQEMISEAIIANLALPILKPSTAKSPHIKVAFGKGSISTPRVKSTLTYESPIVDLALPISKPASPNTVPMAFGRRSISTFSTKPPFINAAVFIPDLSLPFAQHTPSRVNVAFGQRSTPTTNPNFASRLRALQSSTQKGTPRTASMLKSNIMSLENRLNSARINSTPYRDTKSDAVYEEIDEVVINELEYSPVRCDVEAEAVALFDGLMLVEKDNTVDQPSIENSENLKNAETVEEENINVSQNIRAMEYHEDMNGNTESLQVEDDFTSPPKVDVSEVSAEFETPTHSHSKFMEFCDPEMTPFTSADTPLSHTRVSTDDPIDDGDFPIFSIDSGLVNRIRLDDEALDMAAPELESEKPKVSFMKYRELNEPTSPPTPALVKPKTPKIFIKPHKSEEIKGLVDLLGVMDLTKDKKENISVNTENVALPSNPNGVKKIGVPIPHHSQASSITVLTPVKAARKQQQGNTAP